jgi:hypothetical protein
MFAAALASWALVDLTVAHSAHEYRAVPDIDGMSWNWPAEPMVNFTEHRWSLLRCSGSPHMTAL